ncbi:hypothetical protein KFL_001180230 [Klebsormidium nitens]|uniref:Uncharacterized protein n=1 Tax=Klebsormidium nitens TaxID=105231 RepID=A0A1Y1HVI8_KLENI|nr:hypothetical protein KFL_001180230 [Klebsormidium nitens]|eukprot:GAQ82644.1 hypothetical protein KFL_001180230 [Klebsormidium nitens]
MSKMESSIRKRVHVPTELLHPASEGSGNVEPVAHDPPKLTHFVEQGARKVEFLVRCALVTVRNTAESSLGTVADIVTSVYEKFFAPAPNVHRIHKAGTSACPPLPVSQQPENFVPEFHPDNLSLDDSLLATYEVVAFSDSHPSESFPTQLPFDLIGRSWTSIQHLLAYFMGVPKFSLQQG